MFLCKFDHSCTCDLNWITRLLLMENSKQKLPSKLAKFEKKLNYCVWLCFLVQFLIWFSKVPFYLINRDTKILSTIFCHVILISLRKNIKSLVLSLGIQKLLSRRTILNIIYIFKTAWSYLTKFSQPLNFLHTYA